MSTSVKEMEEGGEWERSEERVRRVWGGWDRGEVWREESGSEGREGRCA